MLRTAILFYSVLISSAKILNASDDDNFRENEISVQNFSVIPDPIWVLKVNNDWDMELKPATPDEEEEFEKNTGPLIEDYEKKRPLRVVSPRPRVKVNETINVGKADIFRLLNKFALNTDVEPDMYLTESSEDGTYIALYFKSLYTSLVVNVDNKQWHYFIKPQILLPSWFYEKHALDSGETSVRVPEEVKQRFYAALLRLLLVLLRFPL